MKQETSKLVTTKTEKLVKALNKIVDEANAAYAAIEKAHADEELPQDKARLVLYADELRYIQKTVGKLKHDLRGASEVVYRAYVDDQRNSSRLR